MAQDWLKRLRDGYRQRARLPGRPVRLPVSGPMTVTGEGEEVTITLRPDAVTRNMQDNAAAFEGWCLALRYWCEVDKVVLNWNAPSSPSEMVGWRHYQRFLYRVEHFQAFFPDWFVVAHPEPFAFSRTFGSEGLFLNAAQSRRDAWSDGLDVAARPLPTKGAPEHRLEMQLLRSREFAHHFEFSPKSVRDRQFPVGLYPAELLVQDDAIFPSGKGAIDLVCLDGLTFWLFELKAGSNITVGTISELMFYASIVRDTILGRFKFVSTVSDGVSVRPSDIVNVGRIKAVMLGHDLHPLLSDPGLIAMLNTACEAMWNSNETVPSVSFHASEIVKENPLEIRDIA